MYLSRVHAQEFVRRWRPQIVAGNIVSMNGVKQYSRARVALEDASGAMVQGCATPDVFVFNQIKGVTVVIACLWHPDKSHDRVDRLHALRAWHEDTFPDMALVANDALCSDD